MAHIMTIHDQDYEFLRAQGRWYPAPKLRRFDDQLFKETEEYKYTWSVGRGRKIRLLHLRSGAFNQDIYCELAQADYDNPFHIPVSDPGIIDTREHQLSTTNVAEYNLQVLQLLETVELKYEALSWCWGTDDPKHLLLINERDEHGVSKTFKFRIKKQLALALLYLRYPDRTRTLWIDAVCINQGDPRERSHQVQLMPDIYTRAEEVCIWLGEHDAASEVAIPFVRDEIMGMQNFENLLRDTRHAEKWRALMLLMQRKWFSRRWVVQEIALATKATVHCGRDSMEWKQFATAVELLMEVEIATHRLSEVMRNDVKCQHVPGWFEYAPGLGASLFVQATGEIFRARRSLLEANSTHNEDTSVLLDRMHELQTIDPLDRKGLLSLEYLVSTFLFLETSEPRDAIYSMLAISRDAVPLAIPTAHVHDDKARLLMRTCEPFLEAKPFTVDYRRLYTDVCKDFVSFAIQRAKRLDASQALDILCRPWAIPPKKGQSARLDAGAKVNQCRRWVAERDTRENPWRKRKRDPKDEKVYLEGEGEEDDRSTEQYRIDIISAAAQKADDSWKRIKERFFPSRESSDRQHGEEDEDMPLPSWISQVSRAPVRPYFSPIIHQQISSRSNADLLVGHPQDGHRNYSAAQTKPLEFLKFRRRPLLNHYSLFLKGFILEEVEEVTDASRGGNIPKSWLDLAGWYDLDKDPPIEFWRTLVAGRGRANRNPPHYYATACRESAIRGGIASGSIDTGSLINNERNSIVAEFCRRLQAVIWNRCLFKTNRGTLGLAMEVEKGDKVCILYGCSVPVVLHQNEKKSDELRAEEEEDCVMSLRRVVKEMERLRQRKGEHQAKPKPHDFEKTMKEAEEVRRILREEQEQSFHRKGKGKGNARCPQRATTAFGKSQEQARMEDPQLWYKFRGECYLDGMMDGDAMREKVHRQIEERTFELR